MFARAISRPDEAHPRRDASRRRATCRPTWRTMVILGASTTRLIRAGRPAALRLHAARKVEGAA